MNANSYRLSKLYVLLSMSICKYTKCYEVFLYISLVTFQLTIFMYESVHLEHYLYKIDVIGNIAYIK